MTETNKDFSTVIPSVAFLVQIKAYTTIPFAKEPDYLKKKIRAWHNIYGKPE